MLVYHMESLTPSRHKLHMVQPQAIEKREWLMTDKELRKLRRSDLLELLIEAEKRNEKLNEENQTLREQIKEKKINISKAGSIAEAALLLNGVFEAAQEAANQYIENVKRMEEIFGEREEDLKIEHQERKQGFEPEVMD